MEERSPAKQKRGGLVWLLILVAVVLVWVFFRPAGIDKAVPTGGTENSRDPAYAVWGDPDDILVDLRDDVSDEDVAAIEAELGIDLVLVSNQSEDERFYRANVDKTRQYELLDRLESRPEVEIAEPDALFAVPPPGIYAERLVETAQQDDPWAGFPNDPKYKFQWHLDQVHMPAAWKLSDGEGVIVAVLDTGVAYEDHGKRFHLVPDLAGVTFHKPYNFVDNNEHANDDHGHGTHVTGTIAQATHNGVGVAGVARKATIMPLKVLSGSGSGSVAGIADAIRYAADEGAQVINMSLGGRFPSKVLEKAVKYAHSKGVVVVCAAGNDGRGKVSYPAAYPGAVAVAATQYDESTTFYSNWGAALDVAAPGGNTRVDQNGDGQPDGVLQNTIVIGDPTRDDYFAYMGTSMASPHAAGVAALIVAQGVTDPDAVEKILEGTARAPKGRALDKKHYGAGIIDAEAAILGARGQSGAAQLALGALLAGVVAFSLRRRGGLTGGLALGRAGWLGLGGGVLVGASGLFFLPYLIGSAASWPVVSMLTRGLPSWDLSLLGPAGHGNVLFFSALVPLALIALGSGVARLRAPLAGLCLGVAGHLLFTMAAGWTDVRWMMWDGLWLVANAALLVTVAHLTLRR
jgi:serine protease